MINVESKVSISEFNELKILKISIKIVVVILRLDFIKIDFIKTNLKYKIVKKKNKIQSYFL